MPSPLRIHRCVVFVCVVAAFAWFFARTGLAATGAVTVPVVPATVSALAMSLENAPQAEAPTLLLKVNGQHPAGDVLFTPSGVSRLTLDITPGGVDEPLDLYFAVRFEGQLFWITSGGVSLAPAPLANFTPFALQNQNVLSLQLNGGQAITFLMFFARGNTVVAYNILTAVALPSP